MLVFQNFFYQIKNSYLTPEIFYFNFCPDFMSSHVTASSTSPKIISFESLIKMNIDPSHLTLKNMQGMQITNQLKKTKRQSYRSWQTQYRR